MSKQVSSKRARVLHASQVAGRTKLTEQQLKDQLRSTPNHMKGRDVLAHEQALITKRIQELKADLPHMHGLPYYQWQREFVNSRNKINLLCAANQVGKSTCLIAKNIEWAGNVALWPELWRTTPKIFWYFYPSEQVAAVEFEKKWVPDYLPRGSMKNHKTYGWDVEYNNGALEALHMNSGITLYFKTYGQKVLNLQTSTVHMISCDEEMQEEFVDELMARIRGTGGYFNQVFTATRGLPLWYRAMECIGTPDEAFKTAYKRTVSLYECKTYEDGSPSPWTDERIEEAEGQCTSKREVMKRIHGRFVKDEGLRYESFDPDRNTKAFIPVPTNWKWYSAVDIGSGGKGRSAGAVVFLAVSPTFTEGRVVRTWRGDNEETTSADILRKYRETRGSLAVTQAGYDYASREFGLIAARSGEGFVRADKAKNSGEAILNTLFKTGALTVDSGTYHNQKLVTELMSVPGGAEKNRKFQDDLTDALRYAVALVPWDFATIAPGEKHLMEGDKDEAPKIEWTEAEYQAWEIRQRRGEQDPDKVKDDWSSFESECAAWNDAYGS